MEYNSWLKIYTANFDEQFAAWLSSNRSELGINVFKSITTLGNVEFVALAVSSTVGVLYLSKKRKYIIPFLATIAGAELVTHVTKLTLDRARPLLGLVETSTPSFPSSHATIAASLYGFLGYILYRELNEEYQLYVFILSTLVILLIGFSRLYLGVHFLSDVAVGYLIGGIFLFAGIFLSEKMRKKGKIEEL